MAVKPNKKKATDFLSLPTMPFEVDPKSNVDELIQRMDKISFQGRNLAKALNVWKQMLKDRLTIFLGLSGAMVPAGMRKIMAYLIKNRYIDCLVSTGANLFHDCHESLGRSHFIGNPHIDDRVLKEKGIDRIYDTFASEKEFRMTDDYISDVFAIELDSSHAYTTREFLFRLGQRLHKDGEEEGILTAAYQARIPVYCPAIADSSIGIALACFERKKRKKILFDLIRDVDETAMMVAKSLNSGVIYVGGGVPKNFIQQAEITASYYFGDTIPGHKYAIQITTDIPQWGGLSGCTFQEAQSWGKIHTKAKMATVNADATIVLPFLATALAQSVSEIVKKRQKPKFKLAKGLIMEF